MCCAYSWHVSAAPRHRADRRQVTAEPPHCEHHSRRESEEEVTAGGERWHSQRALQWQASAAVCLRGALPPGRVAALASIERVKEHRERSGADSLWKEVREHRRRAGHDAPGRRTNVRVEGGQGFGGDGEGTAPSAWTAGRWAAVCAGAVRCVFEQQPGGRAPTPVIPST